MLWKISLQIIGCVFAKDMDQWDGNLGCIIRQLFSIVCVDGASVKRLYDSQVLLSDIITARQCKHLILRRTDATLRLERQKLVWTYWHSR
jgi:hypothetical protein